MNHRLSPTALLCTSIATVGLLGAAWLNAGPLNPPAGPVASMYKTLAEVEPRIAINAINTPGDATSLYRISKPGSYYLTGNIDGVAGKAMLVIAANGVTVDLGGFMLDGKGVAPQGVYLSDSGTEASDVTIRDGTIRGCVNKGLFMPGNGGYGASFLIERVKTLQNGGGGFHASNAVHFRDCHATRNSGTGFYVNHGTMESCLSDFNEGWGIESWSMLIKDCVIVGNDAGGISANGGALSHCMTLLNENAGIVCSDSTVDGCRTDDGFNAISDNVVRDNRCWHLGNTAMLVSGSRNRIEGNTFWGSTFGLGVIDPGNVIIRNAATNNSINWSIVAGNAVAPIVQAAKNAANINGNSYAGGLGNSDPNANITY